MNLKISVLRIKQIFYILLFFCLLSGSNLSVYGLDNNFGEIYFNHSKKQAPVLEGNVLKGGISIGTDLPQEFYGTWSVSSTLIDTNSPGKFRLRSSDIWTFQREGDVITLSNPSTNASASITINEVRNNTAIFTRTKKEKDFIQIETPEITVEGDSFFGTDLIIIKHFQNGERVRTDRVKYRLRGRKISGPTLKEIFNNPY